MVFCEGCIYSGGDVDGDWIFVYCGIGGVEGEVEDVGEFGGEREV